ncbi:MAG: hypothetical protein M1335_00845 [Chloroflexi bacterium]|nr:hypothetical protein [Chloroflexota bacterium]
MRIKAVLVIAFMAIGLGLPFLIPPIPAVVVQPEYSGSVSSHKITQTFRGTGRVTGAGVEFSFGRKRGPRRVTCVLSRISGANDPRTWRETKLAEQSLSNQVLPQRGHWVFDFKPVSLKEGERYALTIESDGAVKNELTLFSAAGSAYPGGKLFTNRYPTGGVLTFRLYGEPSVSTMLERLANGNVRPLTAGWVIGGLLSVLLGVGGLLTGQILTSPPLDEDR